MKDLRLSVEEKSIYRVDLSCFFEAAYEVAKKIQEHISEYTAVFIIPGDWLAIECMRYWRQQGIKIPEELSVMGFDNIYMGEIIEPPLTTIHQPKYEMGIHAIQLLESMLNGEGIEKKNSVY